MIKRVKFVDRKLLKSAIIYCSEVQWYLVCTKVVRHIRAVLFWIIYYGSALSKPSYYVLVKQFFTFLFFWEGALPPPQAQPHFVVKKVILIAVVHNCAQVTDHVYLFERMTKWLASVKKTDPQRRKNLADIFYTSRVIVNFVPNFVAMATGVDRGKCNWQHSMAHPQKTPYRRKNLADIFYTSRVIANFVPNFVAMATRVSREKIRLAAFDGPSPKTIY